MTQRPALKTAGVVVALATLAGPPTTHARTRTHGEAPEVRTLDGDANNRRHPRWGAAGARYSRVAKATYADGVGAMVDGPPVRHLSNRIFEDGGQNLFSENGVTHWGFAWGQFLDHGFGLREQDGTEQAPVAFDRADPLERFESSSDQLDFTRTPAAPGTGTSVNAPREQLNTVSSFIAAWNVYGGSESRLEWLREGPVDGSLANNGARLLLTPGGYLPRVGARGDATRAPWMDPIGRLAATPAQAVMAGDVRANENIALTSIHTLFAREHNRIVEALPGSLSEEERFQIARRIVGAEQQYVTYREFLPALGVELPAYRGYEAGVDPTLSNEFAVVGFRAHSMIHGEFEPGSDVWRYTPRRLDALRAKEIDVEVEGGEVEFVVPLNIAFGNPGLVPQIGLGAILAGLGREPQYRNDEQVDNQLRSVLFQSPLPGTNPRTCLDGVTMPECFRGVVDLAALDVERGRDHGMPTYNDLRRAYGLPPRRSFAAITGEESEAFPADPEIDAANPMADPDILDFVELRDAKGAPLEPGTEAADATAVTGVRRTPLAARLSAVYGGDVDRVDAWVGMVSEPHVRGSELGELQTAIWTREFDRLRHGDRFFYRNDRALERIVERYDLSYKRSLAEIVTLNTELEPGDVQDEVFKTAPEEEVGAR